MGQKLVSPATYWRRRVVVLTLGMALLALPTWAVNQALSGSRASAQGSLGSHAGHATGPGRHAQTGTGHQQALAGAAADLGSQQPVKPRPSLPTPGASPSPSPGPGRQGCASGAVTLTIRSAQARYGQGKLVTFVVSATSARSRPCRIDLGYRFASVVVAARGTPIWDSSSCPRGAGSRVVMLRRGSPASFQVTWDRRTSLSGCPGQGSAVRAGTYTVAAFDGQLRSRATSFVLTGRGAAAS
jgi:hypothetical protein